MEGPSAPQDCNVTEATLWKCLNHPLVQKEQLSRSVSTGNPDVVSSNDHPINIDNNPGGTSRDFNYYLPLHKAIFKGDWRSAKEFLTRDPHAVEVPITSNGETALHVAASAGRSRIAHELVKLMPPETLTLQDINGSTALHFACLSAEMINIIKAITNKNRDSTQIVNKNEWTPLLYCTNSASKDLKDIIKHLCTVTRNDEPNMPFSGHKGARLICDITAAGLYDVALNLVQKYPNLATERDKAGRTILWVLAQNSPDFPSGSQLGFWQRCIYSLIPLQVDEERGIRSRSASRGFLIKFLSWTYLIRVPGIKQVYLTKLTHIQALELLKRVCAHISVMSHNDISQFFLNNDDIIETAAMYGIVELVLECIQIFPQTIWFSSVKSGSIVHRAVKHRKEKIINLMYDMIVLKRIMCTWTVESDNNILHLAAKLPPSEVLNTVVGAAFQMQRELQWYKEVEKIAGPSFKDKKNKKGETPKDMFTREHKELLDRGEKWMKDTSQSCMVVAALIATVVFAAAFTVPGGNFSDNDAKRNGTPIFLHKNTFMMFLISDALAFFSSVTSILMFLSILTSRYAEDDFFESLPKKLIIGLATLFFSMAAMVVAFSAALSIIFGSRLTWAYFPIAIIACLPVTLYILLQFPLFVQMVHSTYWPLAHRPKVYKI